MIANLGYALLRRLPAERAHRLALWGLRHGLGPARAPAPDPRLTQQIWGLTFANPLGLAAGFDKDAEAMRPLARLGFGALEVGSLTPRPQPGNPKPRLFRLPEDQGVINRMGFNNGGMEAAAGRIAACRQEGLGLPLGINLGKNKDSADAVADYALGAARLGPLADYLVINVSSPNTPGLRALQDPTALVQLAKAVRTALGEAGVEPPLLLKVAPDLTPDDEADIAAVALEQFDGLIVSNTSLARPASLRSDAKSETGGLSGRPLFAPSTALLSRFYRLTGGKLPLVGVGGIESAETAWQKIQAGASLLQLYSGLALAGPGIVPEIVSGLSHRLAAGGYSSISQAVGSKLVET
ncbi:MAG: quinone-dependent dihydroorotate dehydrogenase [Pseudomonadota bacterium]